MTTPTAQQMIDEMAFAQLAEDAGWPELGRHTATLEELDELKAFIRNWQQRHGLCPSCAQDVFTQAVELFASPDDTLCLRRDWGD